jgi:hypothetical protein
MLFKFKGLTEQYFGRNSAEKGDKSNIEQLFKYKKYKTNFIQSVFIKTTTSRSLCSSRHNFKQVLILRRG